MNSTRKIKIIYNDLEDFFLLRNSKVKTNINKKILVSGLPRSGTTWFGSMLNTQGNIVFHEPFQNANTLWNWNININQGEDIDNIGRICNSVLLKRDWSRYQKKTNNKLLRVQFLHKLINKKKFNIIVKDPTICYFLDSFTDIGFTDYIIIYRNPLSIVGSVLKNGWDPSERLNRIKVHPDINFGRNEKISEFLDNLEALNLVEKIALQTAILHYLMRKKSNNSIIVKYEDYATDPLKNFKELFNRLGLHYSKNTEIYHRGLSLSKKTNYSRHEIERKSSDFINIYNKYLNETQIEEVKLIYNSCNPNPIIKYF